MHNVSEAMPTNMQSAMYIIMTNFGEATHSVDDDMPAKIAHCVVCGSHGGITYANIAEESISNAVRLLLLAKCVRTTPGQTIYVHL